MEDTQLYLYKFSLLYEGQMEAGVMQGHGTMWWQDGSRFT